MEESAIVSKARGGLKEAATSLRKRAHLAVGYMEVGAVISSAALLALQIQFTKDSHVSLSSEGQLAAGLRNCRKGEMMLVN